MMFPSVSCRALPALNGGGVSGGNHACELAAPEQASNATKNIPNFWNLPLFCCCVMFTCNGVIEILLGFCFGNSWTCAADGTERFKQKARYGDYVPGMDRRRKTYPKGGRIMFRRGGLVNLQIVAVLQRSCEP